MKKIGINGFGRIGRAIFRLLIESEEYKVVFVNDLNNDINNLCYLINYDSIYGQLSSKYRVVENRIVSINHSFGVSSFSNVDEVNWKAEEVDYLIESTGSSENLKLLRELIKNEIVSRVFITQSTNTADFEMVLGVNELEYSPDYKIISSSICDTTAVTPILKLINNWCGIESGYLTTLHPVLSYQNILDNRPVSWFYPGQTHGNFPLGRSSIGSLIPKMTTAIDSAKNVIKEDYINRIGSFSYRTPLQSVASAVLILNIKNEVGKYEIVQKLRDYVSEQKWDIIDLNDEPLVSIDFLGSAYSSIVDLRWLEVINKTLRIVMWYDNEVGYSKNVLNQIRFVCESEVVK